MTAPRTRTAVCAPSTDPAYDDRAIVEFALKKYGRNLAEQVSAALRTDGQFAEHVRRHFIAEMRGAGAA